MSISTNCITIARFVVSVTGVSENVWKTKRFLICVTLSLILFFWRSIHTGLDLPKIFPVVQWLVKKAIEVRDETVESVRAVANLVFDREYVFPETLSMREQRSQMDGTFAQKIRAKYGPKRLYRRKKSLANESVEVLLYSDSFLPSRCVHLFHHRFFFSFLSFSIHFSYCMILFPLVEMCKNVFSLLWCFFFFLVIGFYCPLPLEWMRYTNDDFSPCFLFAECLTTDTSKFRSARVRKICSKIYCPARVRGRNDYEKVPWNVCKRRTNLAGRRGWEGPPPAFRRFCSVDVFVSIPFILFLSLFYLCVWIFLFTVVFLRFVMTIGFGSCSTKFRCRSIRRKSNQFCQCHAHRWIGFWIDSTGSFLSFTVHLFIYFLKGCILRESCRWYPINIFFNSTFLVFIFFYRPLENMMKRDENWKSSAIVIVEFRKVTSDKLNSFESESLPFRRLYLSVLVCFAVFLSSCLPLFMILVVISAPLFV